VRVQKHMWFGQLASSRQCRLALSSAEAQQTVCQQPSQRNPSHGQLKKPHTCRCLKSRDVRRGGQWALALCTGDYLAASSLRGRHCDSVIHDPKSSDGVGVVSFGALEGVLTTWFPASQRKFLL
jgi:hypothetical protein